MSANETWIRNGRLLVMRTCRSDLTSHRGFQWPEEGFIEAPDWTPRPVCGQGLHGLPWGEGSGCLLDWSPEARWLAVEVDVDAPDGWVDLGDKVKFRKGTVLKVGDRKEITDFLIAEGADPSKMVGAFVTTGDNGVATAGEYGTATAGNCGTATVGDGGTATVGYKGTATAGYFGTATAGDRGTSTVGYNGTATVGDGGTSTAGECGTASAGNYGTIVITYFDAKSRRPRLKVGYIGEDGLNPYVKYRLYDGAQFEPC
jgi:hypothetical protein